jgi:heme-degrading monooxygenase HmoA
VHAAVGLFLHPAAKAKVREAAAAQRANLIAIRRGHEPRLGIADGCGASIALVLGIGASVAMTGVRGEPMIVFQLFFEVTEDKRGPFEKTYAQIFEPALRRQKGFKEAKLLRLYPADYVKQIGAAPTEHNYQVSFVFESEESRKQWAKSADHDDAWPKLSALANQAVWRGYDIVQA